MNAVFSDGEILSFDKLRGRLHEKSTEVYDYILGDGRTNKKIHDLLPLKQETSKKDRSKEWWLEQEEPVSYSVKGTPSGAILSLMVTSPFWFGPIIVILLILWHQDPDYYGIALCMLPTMGVTWFIFLFGMAGGALTRKTLTIDYENDLVNLSEDLYGIWPWFYDHSKSIELSKIKCVRVFKLNGANRVMLCTDEYLKGEGALDLTRFLVRGKFDSMELAEDLGVKWKPRPTIEKMDLFHDEW